MRVACIITGLGLGGAETQVCALVNELRRRGHDVLLISLTGNTAVLPMELIDVYSFDLKKSPLSFAKSFFDIYRLLRLGVLTWFTLICSMQIFLPDYCVLCFEFPWFARLIVLTKVEVFEWPFIA